MKHLKEAIQKCKARYQQRIKDAYKELQEGMNAIEFVRKLTNEARREKRKEPND